MWISRFSAAPDPRIRDDWSGPTLFGDDEGALLDTALRGAPLLPLHADGIGAAYRGGLPLIGLPPPSAPPRRIVILVHGFEFEPRIGWIDHAFDQPNPHHAIFHDRADEPPAREHRTHNTPWLRRLAPDDGDLIVPFGYASDPGRVAVDLAGDGMRAELRRTIRRLMMLRRLSGKKTVNLFAAAYVEAGLYAQGLAALIAAFAARWRGEGAPKVHLIGHSLGARVVLSALEDLARRPAGHGALDRVGRVILMAAAVSRYQVLDLSSACRDAGLRGPGPEVYNFTSAADLVLRLMGARLSEAIGAELSGVKQQWGFLPSYFRSISRPPVVGVDGAEGLATPIRWADIPLDHPETRAWGLAQGLDLGGDLRDCWMDHWVHFTHAPNWALYRAILRGDADWSIDALRSGRGAAGRMIRPALGARSGNDYRIVRV